MTRSSVWLALPLLLVLGSCTRDPKAVSRRYVQSGNKYYDRGKFKEAILMYRQALARDRLNGDAYYRLGLADLKSGDLPGAYRALLRAVERDDKNVDAMTKLADLSLLGYLADRKRPKQLLQEVRDLSKKLLALDPSSFQGLRLEAYLALADEKPNEALGYFERANSVNPLQRDVVITLIQLLGATKRFPEAEELFKKAVVKDKSYRPFYDFMYVEYLRRSRPADAEGVYKLGMQNNPKDVFYLMRLASYYGGTQRPAEMAAMLQSVLSKPQDFPEGPADVGDFYFRIGQLDQALKNYQQGAQSDPKNKARYQKRVIEVFVQQGKVAEASQLVEAILKENPKDIEATAIRASLSLDSANPEQVNRSVAELQGAINGMPQNPVLRFNLGRAYLAKGDLDQAKIQFQEAIRVRPDYLPARLAVGQLLLLRGDYSGALSMANETLELARNSTVALLVRTGALTGLGNLDQARKELTEVVARFPQSRDARMQLGVLDLQEKKYKDAEAVFERLRAEAPLDPRGVLLLSRTYMAENRGQDAVKLLQSELVKNPDRGDLRLALAGVAMSLNNGEMAIKELTTLVGKNPKDAGLQLRMGDAYRLAGDSKQALSYYQKARELAPNDPGANLYYALMLEANGQGGTARPVYEQILKLQPDNVVALNNLAFLMAESGSDLDQALTLATRAKQRVPSDMNIADTLGWIYIKKNLSDDAIKIFRELVQKNPTHVTWRYHLAMALYQKGDKVQARKELEICLKNRPKKDEEAKIKDLMDKVG